MLTEILASKEKTLKILQNQYQIEMLSAIKPAISFKKALLANPFAIIAEIKRRSPAKGKLASIDSPAHLAQAYIAGGAAAISVLTEENYFGGSLEDLIEVKKVSEIHQCPLLRKDFIISEEQIIESAVAGASAILLIVTAIKHNLLKLLRFAEQCQLEVIVEIHDRKELDLAIESGAEIIAVNNRNLQTLSVNPQNCLDLIEFIPRDKLAIAASGIHHAEQAKILRQAGYQAILVGEALVTANDPQVFLHELRGIHD